MKYIEMIKSVMLILLIGLSLVLTFLIWNTAPYETMGNRGTVDTLIAESPDKKDLEFMIKPYKMHFSFNDSYTGTTDAEQVDYMVHYLKKWRMSNPTLVDQNLTNNQLNDLLRMNNSMVFYYPDEIPLTVYESILNIENPNVPEISFHYIIVQWNMKKEALNVHFVSKENEVHYQSTAKMIEPQYFYRDVVSVAQAYDTYEEVDPDRKSFLVVPTEPIQLAQNTYFPNEKDEINPTRFRSALFSDPNAVRRSEVGPNREDFQDNHALMTVDTEKKHLHFVHPSVESSELAIPSELMEDAIDFVNEHGGWTDEYHFSRMNFRTRSITFKLYVRGVPVLDGNTATEIEEVWGDEAIYQYRRPYYTLGDTLPSEMETITLQSGSEVAQEIHQSPDIKFDTVEEIIPGYYMKQDVDLDIFLFEPCWFYLQNGKWYRFSPDAVGGEKIGLE